MKNTARLLLPALLLGAPVVLAQTPAAQASEVASAPSKMVDVGFRGPLREAIKKIASQGGLNVIVTGTGVLDSDTEVHLSGISAEQALRTLARSYSLKLDEDGGIFTLRPLTEAEQQAAARAAEAPRAHAATPVLPPVPPVPPMPAMPPMPPLPTAGLPEDFDADEIKSRMRKEIQKVRRHKRGGRDVVARGHTLEVKAGETVDSAVVYGGHLVVRGNVEDDAVAFGGNLEVHGVVEGDAHAFGGNVILHPGAMVHGDVSSFGGRVERAQDARVEGSVESFGGANIGKLVAGELRDGLREAKAEKQQSNSSRRRERGSGFPGFLLWFATLFGLGFLGQMFFPARMKELGAEVRAQPVKSGVAGFLGAVALIPLTLVLCATLVGIPVAIALWVVVLPLAAALGLSAVASELGLRLPILRGRKTQAMVLALGLLALLVVSRIPVLGAIVFALATLVGLGAVVRTRFGIRPRGIPEPIMTSTESV